MAIFHLGATVISRCKGGSAVRAAAYRHAVRMVSHALVETTSYTSNAQAMVHAEIALPEDAPEWADNAFGRAALADAVIVALFRRIVIGNTECFQRVFVVQFMILPG